MFTDAEKTEIRHFCGYGAYGSGDPLVASGYRFSTHYGVLEYKLNNLSPSEEERVRAYLVDLTSLEKAIVTASCNLDTESAATWVHNKNEQRDRDRLFESWRVRLCKFLGIPGGSVSSGQLRIVV